MPIFNEASRIYHNLEVNFMRSCFSRAAIMLEVSNRNYSPSELASGIIMLYESGLRDQWYICELAARLTYQRYQRRHDIEQLPATNSNARSRTVSEESNPLIAWNQTAHREFILAAGTPYSRKR